MTTKRRSVTRRSWGSVRPLDSGRYQARYKPHPGAEYVNGPDTFRLISEADAYLAEQRTLLARGEWIDPALALISLEAYAVEWVETRVVTRSVNRSGRPLKPSTRERYRHLLHRHVLPARNGAGAGLGAVALGHIRAEQVRRWRAGLAHIPATQAAAYGLLRAIMATAVADGRLLRSPCQIAGGGEYKSPERPVGEEAGIIAAAALMPERERVWVLLACWGGMRRGELLNLRRHQVDVEMQTIRIGPTRVQAGSVWIDQDDGKSDAAERAIVIPALIMDIVAYHLERFVDADPLARVFTGVRDHTKPVLVKTIDAHWHKARTAIDVKDKHGRRVLLTMHDLRHSGATIQSSRGGATTAELMSHHGWTKPEVAARYDHAVPVRAVEIAETLNERLAETNVVDLFARRAAPAGETGTGS
jgi:integrase